MILLCSFMISLGFIYDISRLINDIFRFNFIDNNEETDVRALEVEAEIDYSQQPQR